MKRISVFLLIALLLFSVAVTAEEKELLSEKEPNETAEGTQQIPVNVPVAGNLHSAKDVDWFGFTLSEAGIVKVSLTHAAIPSHDSYWDLRLYQEDRTTGVHGYDAVWPVAGNADGSTCEVGLPAGSYFVRVSYHPYNHSEAEYRLTVGFTPTKTAEREPNGEPQKATEIPVNKAFLGSLASAKDEDWYRFTLPEAGTLTAVLDHGILSSQQSFWDLRVYLADGVTGVHGYDAVWPVAGNESGATCAIGLPKGEYYLRVGYHPYEHSDVSYSLLLSFKPSLSAEQEPNGEPKKATELLLDTAYTGSLAGDKDEDWYRFELSESGRITVKLDHEILPSQNSFWDLRVYLADGVTGVHGYDAVWPVAGNEAGSTCEIGLPKGTYFVKVGYHPYEHSDAEYRLTVEFSPLTYTEQEPNGEPKKATGFLLDTGYRGAVAGAKDEDWFRFSLPSETELSAYFYHEEENVGESLWDVILYASDGVTQLHSFPVAGNGSAAEPLGILAAGDYYLCVSYHPYNHSDAAYTLKLAQPLAGDDGPGSAPSSSHEASGFDWEGIPYECLLAIGAILVILLVYRIVKNR